MVAKRKAVIAAAKVGKAGKIAVEEDAVEEMQEEAVAPTGKKSKKPAATPAKKGKKAEEHEEAEEMEVEAEEEKEEVNEEEVAAKLEEEQVAARKKELKGMYLDDLKQLLSTAGLEKGKKEDMIAALLAHEAQIRADIKAKEARIRSVVVQKKEELEGMAAPALKELCTSMGIKGVLSKQERIVQLLKEWQDNDGVDKALAQIAFDQRKQDLFSKEQPALLKICDKAGVDAFVQEVMVERIVKREFEMGRFARPTLPQTEEAEASTGQKKGDMVEALLANESKRKQEKESKKQEEDAAASKRKELRSMSAEELKKQLSSKGQEIVGKKEDMVEALFAVLAKEEAAAKKKKELLSMPPDELKQLLSSRNLTPTGKKNDMVEAFLAHEAKMIEESRAYAAKVEEVLAKKKEELETKSASELKELCAGKGLKLGVAKADRVETLLEEAKKDGEVDKVLVILARDARREELLSKDKAALKQICAETGADPLVKEVMVERILSHESEVGAVVEDEKAAEPAAKKARRSAK